MSIGSLLSGALVLLLFAGCSKTNSKNNSSQYEEDPSLEKAVFAGGCFWCLEAPFESIDGVREVISGYAGGNEKDASYDKVSSGKTGHREAVEVIFDPKVVSYQEILDIYWKQFDPTDEGGSFYDRGKQYTSAIYYMNDRQKQAAEESKERLNKSGIFKEPIATTIEKYVGFYPAEEYHQQYYKKNPDHYYSYKKGSGRDQFILGLWGDKNIEKYKAAASDENRKKLSPAQYEVTVSCGTEMAFKNEHWNNHKEGIYVDVLSGEPLFSSRDKFESGSGWPSFTKPIDTRYITKIEDKSHGLERVEVKSKFANSHLGHVFDDGPSSTRLRYCINSAAVRFIPKEDMQKEGYDEYAWLFY